MDLIRERLRARGQHRACFGGDADSSQATTQTDRRATGGHGGAVVSGDANTVLVYATDHGAVAAGQEATRGAINLAGVSAITTAQTVENVFNAAAGFNSKALNFAAEAYDQSLLNTKSTFGQALASVAEAYETAKAGDQRIVSMVGIAAVGLVAVFVIFGKGR